MTVADDDDGVDDGSDEDEPEPRDWRAVLAGDDGVFSLVEVLAAIEHFGSGATIPDTVDYVLSFPDPLAVIGTFDTGTSV